MGYYMRFIINDAKPVHFSEMAQALQAVDAAYQIRVTDIETTAEFFHGETLLGLIDINYPDDGIFEDDIAELTDLINDIDNPHYERIMSTFKSSTAMVAIEAFWQGQDSEATLQKIDPLWDWLFQTHSGLLQADYEGIYAASELLLELNLKL